MTVFPSYERRALAAFAGVAAGLLLLFMLIAGGLVAVVRDQHETLATLQGAVAHAAARRGQSDAQSVHDRTAAELSRRLFAVRNPSDFQSQFQSTLKAAADRHGIRVDVLQPVRGDRVGGLSRLLLRLEGSVPQSRLAAFLADLALQEPAILVQDLELRPLMPVMGRGGGAAVGDGVLARIEFAAFSAAAGGSR